MDPILTREAALTEVISREVRQIVRMFSGPSDAADVDRRCTPGIVEAILREL